MRYLNATALNNMAANAVDVPFKSRQLDLDKKKRQVLAIGVPAAGVEGQEDVSSTLEAQSPKKARTETSGPLFVTSDRGSLKVGSDDDGESTPLKPLLLSDSPGLWESEEGKDDTSFGSVISDESFNLMPLDFNGCQSNEAD